MTSSMLTYIFAVNDIAEQGKPVRSVDIAARLRVARASVCKALDRLTDAGYALRDDFNFVRLTAQGREVVELYEPAYLFLTDMLADKLGLPRVRAANEALAVAGALSADCIKRINEYAIGVTEG